MARLDGKTVVLTGAGRGLGQRLAVRMAREGAQVLALGRRLAKLQETARLAEEAGAAGAVLPRACDVADAAQVAGAFAEANDRWGKLDVLINNAAIYDFFEIVGAGPDRVRKSVEANLLGPIYCVQSATPLLAAAGGGEVLNISSESARSPYALLTVYAATKAALETLSQGLRLELRPHRVRVTTLRLGAMADDDREVQLDEATIQRFLQLNAGAMHAAGGEMDYATVVETIVNMLCLPRDAATDLVELRPSGVA